MKPGLVPSDQPSPTGITVSKAVASGHGSSVRGAGSLVCSLVIQIAIETGIVIAPHIVVGDLNQSNRVSIFLETLGVSA